MRLLVPFLLAATPATAWEFSADPVCTISGGDAALAVTVTFDPATALYAIALEREGDWPDSAFFAIRFEGGAALTITTDRHVVEGTRLRVTDRGFGNVLDGMAGNARAVAVAGDVQTGVSLDGAADPVARLRACAGALAV